MWSKLEFSDLYKFLTSVGLIFIVFSFLLPWLVMNQGDMLQLSQEDYAKLYRKSADLVDKRIEFNLFLIKHITSISAALFVIGLLSMIFGIFKWLPKQRNVDETESLELAKLQLDLERLSKEEINRKAEKEIVEEIEIADELPTEVDENKVTSTLENQDSTKKTHSLKDLVEDHKMQVDNLIRMEQVFYQKIVDYNSFNYKVASNVKLGNKYEVDILLNSHNIKINVDLIFEIKYLQNNLSMTYIRDEAARLKELFIYYKDLTKRNAKIVLIVVYRHDISSNDQKSRFVSAMTAFTKEINSSILQIHAMSDQEVDKFDIRTIIR